MIESRFLTYVLSLALLLGAAACGGPVEEPTSVDGTFSATGPTGPDTTAPSTPAGLNAIGVSPSQINLTWNASADNIGVSGYRIYRGGTLLISLGNVTSYQNTGLSASTAYSYTVQAVDAAGNASAQSPAASGTTLAAPDTTPPSTPSGLTANAASPTQINLSWIASTDNVGVTGYRVYRGGSLIATVGNVTTYQSTGLSSSNTYAFNVQAIDGAGNTSGLSSSASATTPSSDTIAPTTPTGLSATPISTSQVLLTWVASTDNVGVSGYRIYRNGALLTALGNVTTYQDSGLTASTSYTYRVDALDAAGNASASSAPVSATTLAAADTTPPSTPAGLTATATSASQINLSWNASTDNVGVAGYRIHRNGSLISTQIGSATTFQDGGLNASTSYSYRVDAFDAASNISAQSAAASATTLAAPDTSAPSIPAGLSATAASSSQINLSWTASTDNVGVTGYRVYRNGSFLVALGNVTSYQSTGLTASTTYTYRIDAVDAAGNASGLSTQASATTQPSPDTTAPTTPTGLIATAASTSQINLTWTASTDNVGVTGYRVYRNGTLLTTLGNVTNYQNTGLTASTTYSYTVQAIDAAGNTAAQSATATATTQTPAANGTATLTWDPVTASNLSGYRVYYGTTPGNYLQSPGQGISVGNVTTFTVTGLGSGVRYYFAVTAFDASGNESSYSNEAFKDMP